MYFLFPKRFVLLGFFGGIAKDFGESFPSPVLLILSHIPIPNRILGGFVYFFESIVGLMDLFFCSFFVESVLEIFSDSIIGRKGADFQNWQQGSIFLKMTVLCSFSALG